MTHDTTDSTTSIPRRTTRRRTLAALASSTLALSASAGCLTNDSGTNATDDSGTRDTPQLPDVFASVSVGAYELTVEVSNPEELDSVRLRRPTSGVLDRQQAQGTHNFPLMEELDLYEPGEFVLEAKADSEVVAEHTFEMEPDIRITKVELLEDSDRSKLTSTRNLEDPETCTDQPKRHLITLENQGSGPAAPSKLSSELPEGIMDGNRNAWKGPNFFRCHSKPLSDSTTTPVLAPGQRLTFAPVRDEVGYRGQEPTDEYVISIRILENASEQWFSQQVQLTFKDVGDGNRVAVLNVLDSTDD